ncbi:MAG TPA: DUF748 domain-containing protein [Puia sp.]|nr:DUF748 domain-containing protein [Puia sp.]
MKQTSRAAGERPHRPKRHRVRRTILIVAGSLIVILIALRIALPSILLRFVNKELQTIPGYTGRVGDIDVHLIRGAYTIQSIRLDKTGGKIPVPFFSADALDLSVEWSALFHGRLVGKIIVQHPILNFAKGPTKETSQTDIRKDSWTKVVKDLMPLKLNRFEIFDGEIHYRDFYSTPKVNIFATSIHILAQNLSNARHQKEELPSTVEATCDGIYGGHARLSMKLDALNDVPTFSAKAELTDMDISRLNDFLSAYGKFTVKQGTIGIYTEVAAKDHKIAGYTKPIIKDLRVVNWDKDKAHPLKLAWEALIGAVNWVVKNKPKDQTATRVEFSGDLRNPDVNIWYIIGQTLRNGFIQALYPALENSVNINSVDRVNDSPLKAEFQKQQKKDDKRGKDR